MQCELVPTGQSIPQVLISLTQTVTILAEGQKFELYRVSKSVDNDEEANLRISRRSRERPAAGALLCTRFQLSLRGTTPALTSALTFSAATS